MGLLGNHMMLAEPTKTLLWCIEASSHMVDAHEQGTTMRWHDSHTHSIHTTSHVLITPAIVRYLLATFPMMTFLDQSIYQGLYHCSTDPAFLTHNLKCLLLKTLLPLLKLMFASILLSNAASPLNIVKLPMSDNSWVKVSDPSPLAHEADGEYRLRGSPSSSHTLRNLMS